MNLRSLFPHTLFVLAILNFGIALLIPGAFISSWHSGASHVQSTYRQLVKDGRIVEHPAGPNENPDLPVWSILTPRDQSAALAFALMGWSIVQGVVLFIAAMLAFPTKESRDEAAAT